jgi:hypothetical protein
VKNINGTVRHIILGFVCILGSWWRWDLIEPGVWACIVVELVQADVFGWKHLLQWDTWHDIAMDAIGGALAYLVIWLWINYGAIA